MRQKDRGQRPAPDSCLCQPNRRPATGVDEKLPAAGFDKGARTHTIRTRIRCTRPEECDDDLEGSLCGRVQAEEKERAGNYDYQEDDAAPDDGHHVLDL
jgi:hypothetical protein